MPIAAAAVRIRALDAPTRASFEPCESMPMSVPFARETLSLFDRVRAGAGTLPLVQSRSIVTTWLAERGCAPRGDGSYGICPGFDAVLGQSEFIIRHFPGGARDAGYKVGTYAAFLLASARRVAGEPPKAAAIRKVADPAADAASVVRRLALRGLEAERPWLLLRHYMRCIRPSERLTLNAAHREVFFEVRARASRGEPPVARAPYGPERPPVCVLFDKMMPLSCRFGVPGMLEALELSLEFLRPSAAAGLVRVFDGAGAPIALGAARVQVHAALDERSTHGVRVMVECSRLQAQPGSTGWRAALRGAQAVAAWYGAPTMVLSVEDDFTSSCAVALRAQGRLQRVEVLGNTWTIATAG